jgi:predicted  nucleic acid-binding Zn ribbon protein
MKFYIDEKHYTLREIIAELGKQYTDFHNDYGLETREGIQKKDNILVLVDAFELISDEIDINEMKKAGVFSDKIKERIEELTL